MDRGFLSNVELRTWRGGTYYGLAVLILAAIFRYLVVEPRAMGFACSETPQPWWCAPREIIMNPVAESRTARSRRPRWPGGPWRC